MLGEVNSGTKVLGYLLWEWDPRLGMLEFAVALRLQTCFWVQPVMFFYLEFGLGKEGDV